MPIKRPNANLPLVAIVTEGFLSRLSFGLISFALPLYAYRLGLSLAEIGLLASLNLMVALVLKPGMGWAADHVGLKRSFTFAIGLRSLVALLLACFVTPWQLYALRAVHGMSKAIRDPSANALIAEHGGKKAIASAFAWYQTSKSVAGALGKALAGVLLTLTASNFAVVFGVAFALSALPLYVVARYVKEARQDAPLAASAAMQAQPQPDETASTAQAQPSVLPYMGLGALIASSASMLNGLFPILATEYAGLNEAQTGLLYIASTVVIIVAGPGFGWLSDNVSRKLVFLVRSIANTVSSVIYLVFPSFPGVATGRLVDDLGKAAFKPAWGSLLAYVASFDKRRRARTMSYVGLGEDIGDIAGPILAGFLWNTYGITILLGTRIVLAVVAELYALALDNSARKQETIRSAIRRVTRSAS